MPIQVFKPSASEPLQQSSTHHIMAPEPSQVLELAPFQIFQKVQLVYPLTGRVGSMGVILRQGDSPNEYVVLIGRTECTRNMHNLKHLKVDEDSHPDQVPKPTKTFTAPPAGALMKNVTAAFPPGRQAPMPAATALKPLGKTPKTPNSGALSNVGQAFQPMAPPPAVPPRSPSRSGTEDEVSRAGKASSGRRHHSPAMTSPVSSFSTPQQGTPAARNMGKALNTATFKRHWWYAKSDHGPRVLSQRKFASHVLNS